MLTKNKWIFPSSIGAFVIILAFSIGLSATHANKPSESLSLNKKETKIDFHQTIQDKAKVKGNGNEVSLKTINPVKTSANDIQKEREEFAKQKVVFLTFDDGPSPYTSQLLNILKANNIHATFFIIGNRIKGKEAVLKRIVNEGDVIGLHSMTHNPRSLFASPNAYIQEFEQEQQLLSTLGIHTSISRSPYGSKPYLTMPFRDKVAADHLKLWDWTIDSNDWRYNDNTNLIINEVASEIKRQHEVVLMHDHKDTLKALPAIIELFKDRGYTFEAYNPDLNYSVNFWKDTRL
ncbi:polysaccharide deacetylase family protein [Neobacillus cucumis]|uniref:polysaccharide deacetylase family protein n=1 Tax=Neobacillus cucumis TaxID=1740721 RepID=UPI001963144D|nr:polysaccharide deacetylase family protein [Neobacillus cucumis]MBM7653545.1 peptidoglycan/xylan/chitin deacetylase (PgdA/CDA1 family) [Neobacillus cucumis]